MLTLMLAMLSGNVAAEWVRIGENNRSVAYADTAIPRSGNMVIAWHFLTINRCRNLRSVVGAI